MSSTGRGDDRLATLSLMASAIAGRTMDVAAAAGERSWCDGSTVFLELGMDPFDQIQALAVQASLAACGSLEPNLLSQLVHRPALTRRYLALEGHRALSANERVLPPVVRPLIDRPLSAVTATPQATIERARSRQSVPDPPRVFGSIEPRRALRSIERAGPSPLERSQGFAVDTSRGATVEVDDLEDDAGYVGDLLSSPVGGSGVVGRWLAKMLRPTRRRGRGGTPGADAPTRMASARSDASSAAQGYSGAAADLGPELHTIESDGMKYPEWDVAGGRYRPDWCTVVENEVETSGSTTMALSMGLREALRRSLSRLGIGLTPCRRQAQGDDIDIDAAIEMYLETMAGAPPGGDVYFENRRRRRDLGVLVLLDVSGSVGELGFAGRSVHEHQRLVAAALTGALHDLGDRVGLYAFNSRGRKQVQYLRVMGFNAPFDGQAIKRLTALRPSAYTRMGAAIRHATTVLEQRSGTPRRLLVVLSDGFAYDHGYEGYYGEADARRALNEARRRGVGCVCLSVGASTGPEALRRVFGSAAHATVARADDLPSLIAPLFRTAIRSAEGQHRAFQRKERSREHHQMERGRP